MTLGFKSIHFCSHLFAKIRLQPGIKNWDIPVTSETNPSYFAMARPSKRSPLTVKEVEAAIKKAKSEGRRLGETAKSGPGDVL